MHSGFKQMLRVAVRKKLVHLDDQRDWIVAWKFLRPTHDKFFRVIIKVSLVERGEGSIELKSCSIVDEIDSKRSLARLQV